MGQGGDYDPHPRQWGIISPWSHLTGKIFWGIPGQFRADPHGEWRFPAPLSTLIMKEYDYSFFIYKFPNYVCCVDEKDVIHTTHDKT